MEKSVADLMATWCACGNGDFDVVGHNAVTGRTEPYQYTENYPFDRAYVVPRDPNFPEIYGKRVDICDLGHAEIGSLLATNVKTWVNNSDARWSNKQTQLAMVKSFLTALVDLGYRPSLEVLKQLVEMMVVQVPLIKLLLQLGHRGELDAIMETTMAEKAAREDDTNATPLDWLATINGVLREREAQAQAKAQRAQKLSKVKKFQVGLLAAAAIGTAGMDVAEMRQAAPVEPTPVVRAAEASDEWQDWQTTDGEHYTRVPEVVTPKQSKFHPAAALREMPDPSWHGEALPTLNQAENYATPEAPLLDGVEAWEDWEREAGTWAESDVSFPRPVLNENEVYIEDEMSVSPEMREILREAWRREEQELRDLGVLPNALDSTTYLSQEQKDCLKLVRRKQAEYQEALQRAQERQR